MNDPLDPLRRLYGEGGAPAGPPPDGAARVEYEVLRQAREAVERQPRLRPDAAVVEAVLRDAARVRAGTPLPAPAPDRRAADRGPARSPARTPARTTRWAPLAMAAVAVVVAAVWLGRGPAAPADQVALNEPAAAGAAAAETSATELDVAEMGAFGTEAPSPLVAEAAPVPSRSEPLAAAPSPSAFAPSAEAFAPPPPPPAARRSAAAPTSAPVPVSTSPSAASDRAQAASAEAAPWEAGEDLRVLSLRLQALREQSEGLAWDEPPAPFGVVGTNVGATMQGTAMEGVQTVRAGAPASPARVDVRLGRLPSRTNE